MSYQAERAGWATVRLDEIAEVRLGRQRSPKNHTGTQMRPYLRAANVTWAGIDVHDVKQMNFTDEEVETYRLRGGDVLLSEASGSAKEVGKPGVWRGQSQGDVCFQNTLIRVRPESGIGSDFIYYRLLHEALSGGFIDSARGVGIHHLGSAKLAALQLELPPTHEQHRIAQELTEQLERIKVASAQLDTLERRLILARRAILTRVCLGQVRISPSGVIQDPEGVQHNPPGVQAGAALEGELPGMPDGWIWSTLGALADVVGGVTKDSKKQDDPDYVEVPYLRVANVQEGALQLDEVARIRVPAPKADALRLQPGDVLMNEGGDRDKLGRGWVWTGQIADCIHQNHVFRARVREGVIEPKLLSWHGNTYGRAWFEANGRQTTNLASISLANLKRLPVPVPPHNEQLRIVDFIDRHLGMFDMAVVGVLGLRRRCDALYRSVLSAPFSAAVVDADMTHESAEELLRRIAEARRVQASTGAEKKRRKARTPRTARASKLGEARA